MIELIGPEHGDERRAAEWLRDGLLQLWPDIAESKADRVRIHAAAKLFGYRVQDLDVLLLAHFGERRSFQPTTAFRPREGVPVRPRWANVSSLVLVIEVKGHDARAIRFEVTTVQVRYGRGGEESWENASEQSHETGLGIRPMFHWTPRRIVAHVKLCVLALMIQRAAEIATGAPWSQLVDVLERLKAVRYTAEGETIVQASRITPGLAALLKKLDISTPKPILAVG